MVRDDIMGIGALREPCGISLIVPASAVTETKPDLRAHGSGCIGPGGGADPVTPLVRALYSGEEEEAASDQQR
ncbi:hypothetical protein NFI96_006908 [Prochilodus magdalenae]|nr:hypothetical protein NFI96_006908 [Prochilodus magdalenae]